MNDLSLYDIYGYVISVKGNANKIFSAEYGWASVSKTDKIDLYVEPSGEKTNLPTKPAGCSKGIYLPFQSNENTLWYEEGVPIHTILMYCESLLFWKNKTFLHSGCVAKHGKAFIFAGTGNVGKTSIVLNLLSEGYEYLSDDWLIIGEGIAYPFPKLIHVFDYNLKSREVASAVLGSKRFFYKPYFKFVELARKNAPHRYLRYGFEVVKPMYCVNLKVINPKAEISSPSIISKIFYLERKNVSQMTFSEHFPPEELARRMAYVTLYERNYLVKEYNRYVTLKGTRSERMDTKLLHDQNILQDTFEKASIYKVTVPNDTDLSKANIPSLFNL